MMPSFWQLGIILVIVLLVFGGRGRIPQLMKDMGTGITAFRKGLKDDDKKEQDSETLESDATIKSTAEDVTEKAEKRDA